MLTVRKYFCFELVTAGILVGWLGVIESIFSSIGSIIMLMRYETYPPSDMDKYGPGMSLHLL